MMRERKIYILLIIVLAAAATIFAAAGSSLLNMNSRSSAVAGNKATLRVDKSKRSADEIIVKLKNPEPAKGKKSKVSEFQSKYKKIKVNPNTFDNELNKLANNPNVEFAEPNILFDTTVWTDTGTRTTPGDYDATSHWYYEKAKVPEFWKNFDCPTGPDCGGGTGATIAVIDTGVAVENFDDSTGLTGAIFSISPDLEDINLHVNTGETPENGIDDDCNGIIDDYHGIDAYNYVERLIANPGMETCPGGVPDPTPFAQTLRKEGHPLDTEGHGTFVTSIIAADTDDATGNPAPAFNVTIMPIAANISLQPSFYSYDIALAINYAVDQGADVINMSLGGSSPSSIMENAINDAVAQGVVVVASSGNSADDPYPYTNIINYPAAFDNVIAVGAATPDDQRASYSTYGSWVDVAAYVGNSLGVGASTHAITLDCFIGSCTYEEITNDGFSEHNALGTSFSAPQVAALAGIIKSFNNNLKPEEVKYLLTSTATDILAPGKDSESGYGTINFNSPKPAYDNHVTVRNNVTALHRFYNAKTRTHFYTISDKEKDKVIASLPQFTYEGTSYRASRLEPSGVRNDRPVYRFYNVNTGTHFYTVSESEKNKIISTLPSYIFEGEVFYAFNRQVPFSKPVYRFYNTSTGTHFYTHSEVEKQKVTNTLPTFVYEGVAYYGF